MNVAVLGAAGTIAPAIIHDLSVSEEVREMLLLDLDAERVQSVAVAHGGGKARGVGVDARDPDALARALAGVQVLLNTASYRVNLEAMRASLAAGCAYIDLGGLYWMTARQLELADEFERAGLLAVLGMGSSPGKTNLMALRAVRELGLDGGGVDLIEVVAGGRDPLAPKDGRLRPPYALRTLLDELTLAPVVLHDGRAVELEPLAPGGSVDFGPPIGSAETMYTLHSELASFGASFGCRRASFRLSLAPPLLTDLRTLVDASANELAAAAREAASPSAQTVSVHLVRVCSGTGAEATVRALSRPHFGFGGSIVSTAAPAAAAVRLLARGSLAVTGVLAPEQCIDPAQMFTELEARGCEFSVARSG